jgi:tetratricopeptide (TPR) repeat protein
MFNGAGNDKSRVSAFLILGLALLPTLVYLNSLPNSFQYDDHSYILDNAYVHSLSNIPHFFVSQRLISNIPLSGYRPLTMATFALNYAAGGTNPFGYHLFNVFLHVVNTLLVFGVALGLMRSFRAPYQIPAAAAVAAVFACHPLNTQAVNYISARSTLLVGGFSLLCILLYVRRYELDESRKQRGAFFLGISLLAYAGALLSKEEAVAVPGVLAFFELCRMRPSFDKDKIYRAMGSLAPYAVLTLIFLFYVIYGLGVVEKTSQARSLQANLLTQAKALFIYMKMMVLPVNLSIDHVVPTSTSFFSPVSLASILALALMLVGSLSLIYTTPLISFGIWWFVLVLVPTSTLIALKLVVNEQRVYLAGVGLLLAAAAACIRMVSDREAREAGGKKYLAAAVIVIIICLSGITMYRNTLWRTPKALWSDTLRIYPKSFRAATILADLYLDEDKPAEALPMAERAVALAPDVLETHLALAKVYTQLGRNEDALQQARTAVDLNPASAVAQAYLGNMYARMGRYSEALSAWQRAVELNPGLTEARENIQKLKQMQAGT